MLKSMFFGFIFGKIIPLKKTRYSVGGFPSHGLTCHHNIYVYYFETKTIVNTLKEEVNVCKI